MTVQCLGSGYWLSMADSFQKYLQASIPNRITVECRSFRHRARQSGTLYLCHFSTEMAEIWSPATFFQDVFAYKISALYHLYFQSYKAFSGGI